MAAEPVFEPEPILAALNAHGVHYVVVGGLAVAAHGVVRATADLDVVVERTWENAAALEAALTALESKAQSEEPDAGTKEALVRRADRRFRTSHGDLHVLHEVDGVPDYADLQPAAEFDIGGERIMVATLDALRAMKRVADRDKDRIDLAELEALHGPDGA